MALTGKAHKYCGKKPNLQSNRNVSQGLKAQFFSLAYLYGKQEPQLLNVELAGSIGKEREARYVAEEFAAFKFPLSHLLFSQEMKENSFVEGGL